LRLNQRYKKEIEKITVPVDLLKKSDFNLYDFIIDEGEEQRHQPLTVLLKSRRYNLLCCI
jgi:hypothetical protein